MSQKNYYLRNEVKVYKRKTVFMIYKNLNSELERTFSFINAQYTDEKYRLNSK